MIPVSRCTSTSSPTSATTSGSRWNGIGARSSWRPPWLESSTASTPTSAQRARVGHRLHPLDDDLARPLLLDPGQVLVGHGRVEHRVEQLGDRPRPRVERRERERLGGEEVEPPRRARDRVGDRARRQRGRDRHAVADVAQPGAGDRYVDGHEQRVVAGARRPARPAPSTGRGPSTCRAGTSARRRGSRRRRPRSRSSPSSTGRTGCRRPRPRSRPRSRPRCASSG